MRKEILSTMILAAALLAFIAESRTENQTSPPQAQAQAPPGMMAGPPGGMMSGRVGQAMGQATGMTGQLMNRNQQMSDTMDKMMQNMTAMQNEKDPAKMKSMMAGQRALLEKMRGQMLTQPGGMMKGISDEGLPDGGRRRPAPSGRQVVARV